MSTILQWCWSNFHLFQKKMGVGRCIRDLYRSGKVMEFWEVCEFSKMWNKMILRNKYVEYTKEQIYPNWLYILKGIIDFFVAVNHFKYCSLTVLLEWFAPFAPYAIQMWFKKQCLENGNLTGQQLMFLGDSSFCILCVMRGICQCFMYEPWYHII